MRAECGHGGLKYKIRLVKVTAFFTKKWDLNRFRFFSSGKYNYRVKSLISCVTINGRKKYV